MKRTQTSVASLFNVTRSLWKGKKS